jgi:hypothetical protein
MCEQPFGEAETMSSTNDNCRRREQRVALVFSASQIGSGTARDNASSEGDS